MLSASTSYHLKCAYYRMGGSDFFNAVLSREQFQGTGFAGGYRLPSRIRLSFSEALRYGSREPFYSERVIALHSTMYSCLHPTRREGLTFSCAPGEEWKKWWEARR